MRKRNAIIALAVAAIAAGMIVSMVSSGPGGHAGASAARAHAKGGAARVGGRTEVRPRPASSGLPRPSSVRSCDRDTRSHSRRRDGRVGDGLVEALVSTRAAQLRAAVNRQTAVPGERAERLAKLRTRLKAKLERTRLHRPARAARYLGLSTAQLRADLHAGRSLAQIAAATPASPYKDSSTPAPAPGKPTSRPPSPPGRSAARRRAGSPPACASGSPAKSNADALAASARTHLAARNRAPDRDRPTPKGMQASLQPLEMRATGTACIKRL